MRCVTVLLRGTAVCGSTTRKPLSARSCATVAKNNAAGCKRSGIWGTLSP